MSVMRGQCDARPTVTIPTTRLHKPLAGTKLHCLVTKAHVCYQLARRCSPQRAGQDSNLQPVDCQVQRPNHSATEPHHYA